MNVAPSLAVLALLVATQIQMETRFVTGDVLVRFTSGSEGRPASTGETDRVDPFLAAVSRAIGCPLVLQRVASGGDLLLRVDVPKLAARLKDALESHPGVREASAITADAPEPRVAIEVRLTADAGAVARQTARDLRVPVAERTLPEGVHLFEVDLRALTLDVVERLKAREDVDYAQPNYAATR